MDGNTSGRYNQNSCTYTHKNNKAWWQVDLEKTQPIGKVIVYNRADCCGNRLNNFNVYADAHKCGTIATAAAKNTIDCKKVEAQKVKVQLNGNNVRPLTLCEVEVYSPGVDQREDIVPKVIKAPVIRTNFRDGLLDVFERYAETGDWVSGDVIKEEKNRPMKITDVLFEWSHMHLTDDQRDIRVHSRAQHQGSGLRLFHGTTSTHQNHTRE